MNNQLGSRSLSLLIGALTLMISLAQPHCYKKDVTKEKIARLEAMNGALGSALESCRYEANLAEVNSQRIIDSLENIINSRD